ncbi:hypothetical protein M0R89_09250 [Halorussus limi]|uniref:Uncharacterized protein n=1 Tax=Halorussus limi TaxID=2938695 RepID=A0A8U0HPW9_9EURY|nr:hypothetical protein [Halorussus limi]UPV72734.1 hypothetical protein M0R89_09250 [Halorussus limi]
MIRLEHCPHDTITALHENTNGDMVALYTRYGEEEFCEEYEATTPSLGL